VTWPWTLTFEVEFTAGVWTDLSSRIRLTGTEQIEAQLGGRVHEQDRISAGVCTLYLNNHDRALDPTHEGSTFWPNVRPLKQARLTCTYASTVYPVFRGFIEAWTPRWQPKEDAYVHVRLVDGFKKLAYPDITYDREPETSGARINAHLDEVSWPAALRDVAAGVVTLTEAERYGTPILDAIRDSADAEQGDFFFGPDGKATFHDRHHRLDLDGTMTAEVTVDEQDFRQVDPPWDEEYVQNEGRVELEDGQIFLYQDATSITEFDVRSWRLFDVALSPAEAFTVAQWRVIRFAQPHLRIGELTLNGGTSVQVQTQVLERKFGDLIRVERTPPGGGSKISELFNLERVTHRVGQKTWETVWELSPWHGAGPWLIWDTAGSHWDDAKWTP
jgi:hypothetical protein